MRVGLPIKWWFALGVRVRRDALRLLLAVLALSAAADAALAQIIPGDVRPGREREQLLDRRRLIACDFGTELCCQAAVRHQECREITASRNKVQRFSDPPIWPRPGPVCPRGKLAQV